LKTRFQRLGNSEDLNQAISASREAVNLTPNEHPALVRYLHNLGLGLRSRYENSGDIADLQAAMLVWQRSATSQYGLPRTRFYDAHNWVDHAISRSDFISAMEASKVLFGLLPQIVWLGGTVSKRYKDMNVMGDAVSKAVGVAIRVDELQLALEWLEEGRSIVWGQTVQLRTPMDTLEASYPDLARKLQEISGALDHASSPGGFSNLDGREHSLEFQAQAQRRLAEDWERTVEETRELPGFEDFLRPSKFAKLSRASQHGSVVCLHVQKDRSDALILPHGSEDIMRVSLLNLTLAKATALRTKMTGYLSDAHMRMRASKHGVPGDLKRLLLVLWVDAVKPVFDALALRHVWVSPPILAAGLASLIGCRTHRLLSHSPVFSGALQVHLRLCPSMPRGIMAKTAWSIEHTASLYPPIFRQ
jgi:hypothetical protein